MSYESRVKKSDLLYDYIKFHLGLYLATPPVLAIVGEVLGVQTDTTFQIGLLGMIVICFISAAHASYFIASFINVKWNYDNKWLEFGDHADNINRRFIHHYLYWFALVIGVGGLALSLIQKIF